LGFEDWNFRARAVKNHDRRDGPADMKKIGNSILTAAVPLLCLFFLGAGREAAPAVVVPTVVAAAVRTAGVKPAAAAPALHADAELLHDDTPAVPVPHVIWMEVTAYCPCAKCCGPNAHGVTASGKDVTYNGGVFVAADTHQYVFGTKFSIPGYHNGHSVEVIDRGSAIKGDHLDVFFPTHEQALEWGRQRLPVTLVQ
jgi:3D (Asp-Asp-Asp) domain-containing protein